MSYLYGEHSQIQYQKLSVHMMLELTCRFRVWVKVLHPLEALLQSTLAGRRACCPVEGTHEASQRETGARILWI